MSHWAHISAKRAHNAVKTIGGLLLQMDAQKLT